MPTQKTTDNQGQDQGYGAFDLAFNCQCAS